MFILFIISYFNILNKDTSYFFYGLAFHFTKSSFRTSIYILISKVKVLTIRLKNSSDPIGFPLKVTELLTWYIFIIYLI